MLSLFLFVLGYEAKQNILMFSPLLIALLFLDIYKTLPKTIQERGYSYRWHYGLPMVVVLLTILFYKGADNVPLVQIYALDFEVYQTIQSTYSKAQHFFRYGIYRRDCGKLFMDYLPIRSKDDMA